MAETTTPTPAAVNRTPREVQTRDTEVRGLQERNPEEFRKYQWKPADALPMPKAPPGWHYRYIRKSIGAEQDVNNFGRAMREGWVTVPLADHPELVHSVDPNAKNSGLIEIGALVLCKLPVEVKQSRDAYYAQMNSRQMEAVDSNLMRENNPKMPLFNEKKTEVSFGKGT
jgi:hypothetical protein